MVGKVVCPFHGGKSKAGPEHPAWRHGGRSKGTARVLSILSEELRRPVQVVMHVYPMTVDDAVDLIGRGARLVALAAPSEDLPDRQRLAVLRAARRELERQIRALREQMAADETPVDDRET
jgi:hypothetical protein